MKSESGFSFAIASQPLRKKTEQIKSKQLKLTARTKNTQRDDTH